MFFSPAPVVKQPEVELKEPKEPEAPAHAPAPVASAETEASVPASVMASKDEKMAKSPESRVATQNCRSPEKLPKQRKQHGEQSNAKTEQTVPENDREMCMLKKRKEPSRAKRQWYTQRQAKRRKREGSNMSVLLANTLSPAAYAQAK
eukprot:s2393_g1.t1